MRPTRGGAAPARRAPRDEAWPAGGTRAPAPASSSTCDGGSPSRTMPASARTGPIVASRRSRARRGSLSRRKANTSSAPPVSSDAGRARVGSSAASSHSSSTTGGASAPPSTGPPSLSSRRSPRFHGARERRARPPSTQAAIAPLERRVTGAGGQLRPRSGEPREEVLGRAGDSRRGDRQPDARVAQGAPRELVDGTSVEVVDECLRVAVERLGRRGGRGVGDRIQLRADVIVEGGAPQRMPAPVCRLEVRMHEAVGDRPAGDVEHRERDPRRPALLDPGRWIRFEREQLVQLEPARADAVPCVCDVRHGGHADVKAAGRERCRPPCARTHTRSRRPARGARAWA